MIIQMNGYFKNFPHNRLVVPFLKPIDKSICSCTEIYLIQHAFELDSMIREVLETNVTSYYLSDFFYTDKTFPNKYSICFNNSFKETVIKCNFAKRLQTNCKIFSIDWLLR